MDIREEKTVIRTCGTKKGGHMMMPAFFQINLLLGEYRYLMNFLPFMMYMPSFSAPASVPTQRPSML